MAMVISDSFPCFYTLTDVQWKHINTCFIRHGNSQQHTDTLHETEYACHYLGLHLLTVMGAVTDKSQPRHKKYTQFYREEGVFFGIIYV